MASNRGAKSGSHHKPDPVKDAIKAAIPGKISRYKPEQEFFQGTKQMTLKMDAVSHATLDIHARRRGVNLSWLMCDILNLWMAAATDYDQAIFRELLPPKARAARTPERFPGYIDSLGFVEAPQAAAVPTAQAPVPTNILPQGADHTFTAPLQPQVPTLADLSTPYRHPSTQGPASYPHPAPGLPHNAGLFNPEEHNRVAPQPGMANAAQRTTMETEDIGLPPLAADVQAMLDFYRVDPEDVR